MSQLSPYALSLQFAKAGYGGIPIPGPGVIQQQDPGQVEAMRLAAQQRQQQAAIAESARQQAAEQAARQQAMAQQAMYAQLQQREAGRQRLLEGAQQGYFAEQSDYRREGIQARQAERQVDLQARLNEIQLGQTEEMRMQRLRQARASVQGNPDLTDQEKHMLMTQIDTGLNPLENRMRESQMLHQQIQSQAAYQNMQQQATLFNQQQEHIARGIRGALETVEDPNTGYRQLFHRDAQGRITPLDFSQSQQRLELAQAQAQVGMASDIQGMQQRSALFPGQMQLQQYQIRHSSLANDALAQEITQSRDMNPLRLQSLQAEIEFRRQAIQAERQRMEQSGQRFPLEQRQLERQLDIMAETLRHNRILNPIRENAARFDLETLGPAQLADLLARTRGTTVQSGLNEQNLYGGRTRASIEAEVDAELERTRAATSGAPITPEVREQAVQTRLNELSDARPSIGVAARLRAYQNASAAMQREMASARAATATMAAFAPNATEAERRLVPAWMIGNQAAQTAELQRRLDEELRFASPPAPAAPGGGAQPNPRPINLQDPTTYTPDQLRELSAYNTAEQRLRASNLSPDRKAALQRMINDAYQMYLQYGGIHGMNEAQRERFQLLNREIETIPWQPTPAQGQGLRTDTGFGPWQPAQPARTRPQFPAAPVPFIVPPPRQ